MILKRVVEWSDVPGLEPFGAAAAARATRRLRAARAFTATPLAELPDLAGRLGVASFHLKDESGRLGLGCFKGVGAWYAVARLADAHVGDIGRVTFACATDGNHGRCVAAAARAVGARSVVFVHPGVSKRHVALIRAFGADVRVVKGAYDDAVDEAARCTAKEGWTLVSDSARHPEDPVPQLIMQGYTIIAAEILRQLPVLPTHVFLQAGVGGLAAAIAAHMAARLGKRVPEIIVVEPDRAACMLESVRAGRPVTIPPSDGTAMAMLDCQRPSLIAWRLLSRLASALMTVGDADAEHAAAVLRVCEHHSGAFHTTASGAAGVAGAIVASRSARHRRLLALDPQARILAINTEGIPR